MANLKTTNGETIQLMLENPINAAELMTGNLTKALRQENGDVVVNETISALKLVDIADVDLLLTFANGEHIVILNGALDALKPEPVDAIFADQSIALSELFKLVGIVNPSKAGSLRLVSENIDAEEAPQEPVSESNPSPDSPPPAPMVKVGVGSSSSSMQNSGDGGREGDVADTVVPPMTPPPTVYKVGKKTQQSIEDLLNGTGLGQPNVSQQLFTSSEFKVTPSGRSDLPLGAYDPAASSEQLELRSSPSSQATKEIIFGTSDADTINFNTAFSTGEGQWSKTLHATINNFSDVTSIALVFNPIIASIPGFDITGAGVTRDSATSNSWHITPTADMLLNGLDINLVYNVDDSNVSFDFAADLIVHGFAGVFEFEVINNLNFTLRDANSQDDFTVTSSTGAPLMVLPRSGVGVEVFAGANDDVVHSGAGRDILHGEDGNDTLNAGVGNDVLDGGLGADILDGGQGVDTATYENAVTGVIASLDSGLALVNTNEAAGDTYVNIENLTGSIFGDTLVGDAQANILTGGAGNDILIGRGNGDVLEGGEGNDTASYEYAFSTIIVDLANGLGTQGEADGDTLNSIENIIGGSGNDTIISATGIQANSYDGRSGIDSVSYINSVTGVTATLTTGISGVVQSNEAAGDSFSSIENLIGSNQADTLIGNADNNVLNGNLGDDLLEGLAGADTFIGGSGDDTVSYEHSSLGVTASLNSVFTVGPAVTLTNDALGDTFSSIENLTGSNFSDVLIGDDLSNTLTGGSGDDELEGMSGADILVGGLGSDTASYAHSVSAVSVSLTTGVAGFTNIGDAVGDTFQSIENITGSEFNDLLIGNSDDNILIGNGGDDVFEGLAGADTLMGGAGTNTASYAHGTDQSGGLGVTASLLDASINTGDALGDSYSQIQNLTGSAFDDSLEGDENNNLLIGGAGNDTITGGTGEDSLFGGAGNDNLSDDGEGAAVLDGGSGDDIITLTNYDAVTDNIDGGTGTDTLVVDNAIATYLSFNMNNGTLQRGSALVRFTNIENITVASTGSALFYADNFDNVITGGSGGNDDIDYRYAPGGIIANLNTGVVTGGSGNDTLVNIENLPYGTHYNDVLIGDDNDNQLQGGQGADILDGGAGYDLVRYDYYSNGSVTVSLMDASINTTLGIVFTNTATGDTLANFERVYGSGYSDFIYGDGNANRLDGNGGDDVLEGMAGADQLYGGGGNNTASYANAGLAAAGSATTAVGQGVIATLTPSFSTGPSVFNSGDAAGDTYFDINTLVGSTFNDVLIGNANNNVLEGSDGDDVLEGLTGADFFNGGTGSDTVSYAHSTVGVTADISNIITGTNDATGDQFFGIENITGSIFDDALYGDGNNNILDGNLGTNTLNGGGGFDTASYLNAIGGVTIDLEVGTVNGAGRNDTLINIERVIGSVHDDTIIGSAGDDWIDAGQGADNIDGGLGNDTLSYLTAISGVVVTINGTNSQSDSISNINNLYGSSYGDVLTGDGADNIIEGGLGNDILDGAAGINTVSYVYSNAAVSVNISSNSVEGIAANSATGGEDNDTLTNFQNITGSKFDDILVGDANANSIMGGKGNDLIIGGAGTDTLAGGDGIDTVSYSNALAGVAVTINSTGISGDAAGDILSGIENLIGSEFDDTLTGDASHNVIDGGAGDDIINAGAGVDTITYITAPSAVVVNLSNAGINATGGAGNDTLTNFENVIGSNSDDSITGNGAANIIEGMLGNDTLDGVGGTDTVSYSQASSSVSVNISGATLLGTGAHAATGGAGNDTLSNFENITGSAFDDTLIGDRFNNVLEGGAGNDLIVGGAGADSLIGGEGIDTASYINATSAVRATLGGASLTHLGDALGDIYSSIENLTGSDYNDILYGDNADNLLIGGLGDDLLRGYNGNDVIDASQGFDTVYGGNGDDVMIVSANSLGGRYRGESNSYDLNGGGDTIKLTDLVAGSYSMTSLANITDTSEILDIRDNVNTILQMTSSDVRNFADNGNGSNLWVKAESGDSLNFTAAAGETLQSFNVYDGVDYVVFDSSDTKIAAIHWQTA